MSTIRITVAAGADSQDAAWRRDMALFYVGVPVAVGFLLGWTGAGSTAAWPKDQAVSFWIATSLIGTMTADLGTRVVATLVRPLGWPLTVALALGVICSGLLVVPLNYAAGELFRALGYQTPGLDGLAHHSAGKALESMVAPVLIWTLANLAFMRVTGRARYGYAPAAAAAAAAVNPAPSNVETGEPAFMARVRPGVRGRLIALKAELHYLRVVTEFGEDLIHCRFSDAIEQAGPRGLQVHRSWWVAHDAIAERRGGDSPRLILRNGLTVPVSRSWASRVRAAVSGR
jgi:hypothetical protein